MRDKIAEKANRELRHPWIITDALKDDTHIDITLYLDTIDKIASIESKYTDTEIEANDLLFDIWQRQAVR